MIESIIVPYDIPLKNIQDMAYGTSEITTHGILKMTYGVIWAGRKAQAYQWICRDFSSRPGGNAQEIGADRVKNRSI